MRFLLALLTLFVGPALAQTVVDPTQIALVCAYNSVVPAPISGQYAFVQCDSTGKLITTGGGGGTPGGSNGQIQYNNAGALAGTTTGAGVLTAIGSAVNAANGLVALGASGQLTLNANVSLWGDAANLLSLHNGNNSTYFRSYGAFTDINNGEWLEFTQNAAGNAFVRTGANGTGTARALILDAQGMRTTQSTNGIYWGTTAGTNFWEIASNGIFAAVTDNLYDIGTSGAYRPRNLYVAGTITTGSAATFHTTSVALTNGAGASAGTMTNAPAAGNPTKWIGINDNGTTRYIPAW